MSNFLGLEESMWLTSLGVRNSDSNSQLRQLSRQELWDQNTGQLTVYCIALQFVGSWLYSEHAAGCRSLPSPYEEQCLIANVQLGKRIHPLPGQHSPVLLLPCSSPSAKAQDCESGWLNQVRVCFELGCGHMWRSLNQSEKVFLCQQLESGSGMH